MEYQPLWVLWYYCLRFLWWNINLYEYYDIIVFGFFDGISTFMSIMILLSSVSLMEYQPLWALWYYCLRFLWWNINLYEYYDIIVFGFFDGISTFMSIMILLSSVSLMEYQPLWVLWYYCLRFLWWNINLYEYYDIIVFGFFDGISTFMSIMILLSSVSLMEYQPLWVLWYYWRKTAVVLSNDSCRVKMMIHKFSKDFSKKVNIIVRIIIELSQEDVADLTRQSLHHGHFPRRILLVK